VLNSRNYRSVTIAGVSATWNQNIESVKEESTQTPSVAALPFTPRGTMMMTSSNYTPRPDLTPQLVKLISKIEDLTKQEPAELALSALFSAALRLETCLRDGNEREAAEFLALAYKDVARQRNN
jgi:hypothetical protein